MGPWTIYSIGDAAFLERVMNGVAMVFGSGDQSSLIKTAMLIGVLVLALQALASGGKGINWGAALVSWIVYSGLYGTPSTVLIEDTYSGTVRPVANVPIGVALVGSIVSKVGYHLTDQMERAYGSQGMLEHGWADSLNVIQTVRRHTLWRRDIGAADSPVGAPASFWDSWLNYVAECTTVGIDLGKKDTHRDVKQQADWFEALNYPSQNWGTSINLSGVEQQLTCRDAALVLKAYTQVTFLPTFKTILLAPALKVPRDEYAVTQRVQGALDALNLGTAADDFIIMAIMERIFDEGVAARYDRTFATHWATTIRDGLEQKAQQAMAESVIFGKYLRPIMSFLEGFIYAVTPLTGVLVATGPQGLRLVGKYLIMLLWIQFWTPVLSIIHLFVTMSASGQMANLAGTGGVMGVSFQGIQAWSETVETWLSVGGMLAAMTPPLALMLATGAAVSATAVAGALKGSGDHVDETKTAPDSFKQGPMMQIDPRAVDTPTHGTTRTGAQNQTWKVDIGQQAQDQARSAETHYAEKAAAFDRTLSSTVGSAASTDQSGSARQAFTDTISAGSGETASVMQGVQERVGKVLESAGVHSDELARKLSGEVAGNLTAGWDMTKAGLVGKVAGLLGANVHADVGGRIAGGVADSRSDSYAQAERIAAGLDQTFGSGTQWDAALRKGLQSDIANDRVDTARLGLSETDQRALSSSAREAEGARRAHETASSFASSVGTSRQVDAIGFARQVNKEAANGDARALSYLQNATAGRQAAVEAHARDLQRMDPTTFGRPGEGLSPLALTTARLATLAGQNPEPGARPRSDFDRQKNQADLLTAFGLAYKTPVPEMGRPDRHAGMVHTNAVPTGSVRDEALAATTGAGGLPASGTVSGQAVDDLHRRRGIVDTGRNGIETQHEANRESLDHVGGDVRAGAGAARGDVGLGDPQSLRDGQGRLQSQSFVTGLVNGLNALDSSAWDMIRGVGEKAGLPANFLPALAKVESSGDANAQATTSSATGPFQFTEQTWLATMHKHGAANGLQMEAGAITRDGSTYRVNSDAMRAHIMELRKDPEVSAQMAAAHTSDNAAYLEGKLKHEPSSTDLYMAHFLGASGAASFITAKNNDPNQPAHAIASESAVSANKDVFYEKDGSARSAGEVYSLFENKLNRAS